MAAESHQNDIPVWFNGTQRWMTGLTKRTTCDDVIYALLVSTGLHETESTDNFAIFEKWREVERPLSARTKLLKVWSSWGEEQSNVQLSMRSLNDYFLPGESSLYMRSRRRHKRPNKNKERHTKQCRCHDQRDYSENSRLRTMEHLVKLVVGQERQIQDLNDRIYDTDILIDKHEARIHMNRVQQNGHDYVQNSYLNNHSSQSSSSSSADSANFSSLAIKDFKIIFRESSSRDLEEIVHVCDNLTHVERRILQQEARMNETMREIEKLAEVTGVGTELDAEADVELEEARVDMIRAVTTYVTNEYNERELDRKIDLCLGELASRTENLKQISQELCDVDSKVIHQNIFSSSYNNKGEENNPENQHTSLSYSLPAKAHTIAKTPNQNIRSVSWQVSNGGTALNYEQHPCPTGGMGSYNQRSSAQIVRNVQTKVDTTLNSPEACGRSASRRSSIPDKDCENSQNLKSVYSDHSFQAPISRESRSIYRSKDSRQPRLYSRSRSAERSYSQHRDCPSVAEKREANSTNEGISGKWDQSCDQARLGQSESAARAIIDQYGLDLGNDLSGHDLQTYFKQNRSFLSSNACHDVSATASVIKSKPNLKYAVSTNTDHELEYRGNRQQSPEWGNCMYGVGEKSHRGISAHQFSPDYSSDSRTSVNNLDREKSECSHSFTLYKSGDEKRGILCSHDVVSKDSSLFDKKSDLPRTKSYTTDITKGQTSNSEGIKPPSANNRIDQVNERDTHPSTLTTFKTPQLEHHDQFFRARRSSSANADCFEKKRETSQNRNTNFLQESPISSLAVTCEGKQLTHELNSNIMNSYKGRQTLKDSKKRDRFRQNEQIRKKNDTSDGIKQINCVSNNNGVRHSLYSRRRRQGISLLHNSSRSLHENGTVTSSSSGVTVTLDRCDLCLKNKSTVCVHKINSPNHILSGITCQPKKEHRFNFYTTEKSSNKIGDVSSIREKTTSNSDQTPALNPDMTSSPSNMTTASVDTNRGALYHIVSNKINKSKSESINNQNGKMESAVLNAPSKEKLIHKPPNMDRAKAIDVESGIYNVKRGNSQYTQACSNRELINIPSTYSCNSVDQYNSPSTYICNSGEQYNSSPTYMSNSGDQYNSPSTYISNSGEQYNSPSTHSYNSSNQRSSPSTSSYKKEYHNNSASAFSSNSGKQQNSPSILSCSNSEKENSPSIQNSPSVLSSNSGEQHNSPSTLRNNNPANYNSPSTLSNNSGNHYNSPSTLSNNSGNHYNSPSTFSNNSENHYNGPSTFSCNNRHHYNRPPTFCYSNTDQPNYKPTHDHPSQKHSPNDVSVVSCQEGKTEDNNFIKTTTDRPIHDITRGPQTSNHGNTNHNCVNFNNTHSSNPLSSPSTIFQNSKNSKIGIRSRDLIEPVHTKNITYSANDFYSRKHDIITNENITTTNLTVGVKTKLEEINDSNSDTGLSSMHSDETQNLETLV